MIPAVRRVSTLSPTSIAGMVFVVGLLHRAIQLWLVADPIARQARLNPDWQSMQYLPTSLLEQHFAAAMLYLQQTPPLPMLLVGILSQLTADPAQKAIVTIAFAGLLSCIAGALLVALLLRLRVWTPLAVAVALLFLGNGGVVLLEYTAFGQCFYEQLAMVACLIAALAATVLVQDGSWKAAAWLGFAVALAALSRATFSYLVFPVIAWLLWQKVAPRHLLIMLLPVALLHGGWAAKHYWVQGQWLWATSSWGGANAQIGDFKRNHPWPFSSEVDCAARWPEPLASTSIFYTFTRYYPDADLARNTSRLSAELGPSPAARAADLAAWAARGSQWVPLDSASFRELSACVQRMYIRHWLRHPLSAATNWAESYALFWQPLDTYTAAIPVTLVAQRPALRETGESRAVSLLRHYLSEPAYFVRQEKAPMLGSITPRLLAANVVAIPFAPQLATFFVLVAVHSVPFVAAYIYLRKRSLQQAAFPAGFSFLLLLYIYVAGISNLVEYMENMRFRLPVEPIAWAIGTVAIVALIRYARSAARTRESEAAAAAPENADA